MRHLEFVTDSKQRGFDLTVILEYSRAIGKIYTFQVFPLPCYFIELSRNIVSPRLMAVSFCLSCFIVYHRIDALDFSAITCYARSN